MDFFGSGYVICVVCDMCSAPPSFPSLAMESWAGPGNGAIVSCILYVIYFCSDRSCSYSSVVPPGGGFCTVRSHLAPAEVSFRL